MSDTFAAVTVLGSSASLKVKVGATFVAIAMAPFCGLARLTVGGVRSGGCKVVKLRCAGTAGFPAKSVTEVVTMTV